ncbi:hypothetical protein KO566_03690 [Flavobacteriaceae bacterium XHP0103]|uniref:hypothetical protein n=1 Tax=Marixanthotalea marina TaxID=2844359 RepID=UPI002989A22D|nr:hypothetical protein [Marixanthotalea marina]MBU3821152.1 hypothetical protein [Marixanthotalea marina]
MEHGFLILAILVLLFAGMYGYSFIPVALEKKKEQRLKLEQERLEEERRQRKIKNQELRDEKFHALNKRSQEIRKELERLEQMKKNRKGLFEDEMNQMKVDKMKKQKAG